MKKINVEPGKIKIEPEQNFVPAKKKKQNALNKCLHFVHLRVGKL